MLVACAEMLVYLLGHFENVEMKTARIRDLEHEADDITHEIYRQVYQTFLTPLDREDIVALAQKLDDVMDFIEGSTTAIRIYGITEPTPAARSLADLVRLQCIQVERAVSNLRHKGQAAPMLEHCMEVNRLENEADALLLSATAVLLGGEMMSVDILR